MTKVKLSSLLTPIFINNIKFISKHTQHPFLKNAMSAPYKEFNPVVWKHFLKQRIFNDYVCKSYFDNCLTMDDLSSSYYKPNVDLIADHKITKLKLTREELNNTNFAESTRQYSKKIIRTLEDPLFLYVLLSGEIILVKNMFDVYNEEFKQIMLKEFGKFSKEHDDMLKSREYMMNLGDVNTENNDCVEAISIFELMFDKESESAHVDKYFKESIEMREEFFTRINNLE